MVKWWHAAAAGAVKLPPQFMPSQSRQAVHCVLQKQMSGPHHMKVADKQGGAGLDMHDLHSKMGLLQATWAGAWSHTPIASWDPIGLWPLWRCGCAHIPPWHADAACRHQASLLSAARPTQAKQDTSHICCWRQPGRMQGGVRTVAACCSRARRQQLTWVCRGCLRLRRQLLLLLLRGHHLLWGPGLRHPPQLWPWLLLGHFRAALSPDSSLGHRLLTGLQGPNLQVLLQATCGQYGRS